MSDHWSKSEKGQKLIKSAFESAKLPEVEKSQLETGTYTNQQVAEKCGDPAILVSLLMKLPINGGNASRRSILSFAVDLILKATN